jgi:electron transport complex protein RnfE
VRRDSVSTKNKIFDQFRDGIITNNPVFVQLLGTCPALATTTSASNALGMGLSVILVLVCSNMFISLLRKFIPGQIRIASYIVIISGFVSMLELLIKAYLPSLSSSLGLFIPLIVVNCIILARAEAFASKNKVLPSIVDGLAMGTGFTVALARR